ncbi:M48 family metallopeptidase [Sandarakinorhabdus rubra]|uniref:M48 family metallopeptidase n=1 Tax=Sandarakinorhabdus rubra TaxID=2672568 RepID=UPI0013DC6F1A|nr:YgjP-like metallopeptidase domain-containing protein [Sandarakinorhabdus rubra]
MLRWLKPALPTELTIAGRPVPVVATRRAGARTVRLKANAITGRIELSLPGRGGEAAAATLLKSHHGWLEARVSRWPRPLPFRPGAHVPVDGEPVLIDWHPAHPRTPLLGPGRLRVGGPAEALPGRVERWLKARARADMEATTLALAGQIGRRVARVAIADQSSRWGSCAGWNRPEGARIGYSWRLILAPAWVRRAIVAHEVAHLVHPDHSPAFHALNRQLDPRATEARRWLARHGAALHWVGREI